MHSTELTAVYGTGLNHQLNMPSVLTISVAVL